MSRTLRLLALSMTVTFALAACATSKPAAPAAPAKPVAEAPKPAATPAPTPTPKPKPSSSSSGKVVPADEATLKQYRAWIDEARVKHPYPDSADRMYAVMMCESRGAAGAVNPFGGYTGLFQYAPTTWSGAWNTYRDGGIKDAKSQIFATALAWKLKMQGQWGCYKKTG